MRARLIVTRIDVLIAHKLQPISATHGAYGGSDGCPSEARDHGGQIVSLVETVFEFGAVARDMLAVIRAVNTCDGGPAEVRRWRHVRKNRDFFGWPQERVSVGIRIIPPLRYARIGG